MDELTILDELLKVNNIHHSLNESNIMTYIILLETNKSKFSESQIKWINDRIASLNEKQKQSTEASLANIDVEVAKMPLSLKTSDSGYIRENPPTNHTENYGLLRDV
jgi:hypothetical protein